MLSMSRQASKFVSLDRRFVARFVDEVMHELGVKTVTIAGGYTLRRINKQETQPRASAGLKLLSSFFKGVLRGF